MDFKSRDKAWGRKNVLMMMSTRWNSDLGYLISDLFVAAWSPASKQGDASFEAFEDRGWKIEDGAQEVCSLSVSFGSAGTQSDPPWPPLAKGGKIIVLG